MRPQPRQDAAFKGFLENITAVTSTQRRVPDIACTGFGNCPTAGKQRHLVGRAEIQILVLPEHGLRAIAVMNVKIDDGDPLGIILGAGVQPGDRDIVEDAEPHCDRPLGMMATWTHGTEGILCIARHHLVDGPNAGPDGA